MHSSTPSTLLLVPDTSSQIPASTLRSAVVLRILRYVSPHPWGSPSAQSNRRSASVTLIADRLWGVGDERRTFSAGGEVMWTPVVLKANGRVVLCREADREGERCGWLASRAPPMRRLDERSKGGDSRIEKDAGTAVLSGLRQGGQDVAVLFDCRFNVRFRTSCMPEGISQAISNGANLRIVSHGRWLLPKVVLEVEGGEEQVLGAVDASILGGAKNPCWLEMEWVRVLDAF